MPSQCSSLILIVERLQLELHFLGTKHFTQNNQDPLPCLCCSVTPQAHTLEQTTATPIAPYLMLLVWFETGF